MARNKRNRAENQPHHIMCKSIKELRMFVTDDDKEIYLGLIKSVALEFQSEVIAYCLMDTHIHLLLHPRGADIGKVMRKINNTYAKYYNRTHGREGHLFGERYKNIVIDDLSYLFRASTYIHNNVKDIPGYKSSLDYPYSSLRDYIDPEKGRGIANSAYILELMGKDKAEAIRHYKELMEIQNKGEEAFVIEMMGRIKEYGYHSVKGTFKRDIDPEKLMQAIGYIIGIKDIKMIHIKYSKRYQEFRSITAIALRTFCNMSLREMTKVMKGQSITCLGRLAQNGLKTFEARPELFTQILERI
jgi:REP element-mobilizing transposase RayT